MAPLFAALGPESIVGDFARRQYQFASFVTLEEPDGSLSSVQHMNSHSGQSVPYEQWSFHRHIAYAAKISDAVPFALHAGYAPQAPGGRSLFVQQQKQMEQLQIETLPAMEFGVRSYPSNYLHLPPSLLAYPPDVPPDLSVHTRPMEHLAYAKWFKSPIVRDEFFMRRMPDYHLTIYSGPCKEEISNAGGTLNGIGAGGIGQLWVPGAGTKLMAATDLAQKPDADFDRVWSGLAINAIVAQTANASALCTGWTGSLMEADEPGRVVTIHEGMAPALTGSYGTPMTGKVRWSRTLTFSPSHINVSASINAGEPLTRAAELLPVAIFKETALSAFCDTGAVIAAPWTGRKRIREIVIERNHRAVRVVLDQPLEASWGGLTTALSPAVGQDAVARSLQLWLEPHEAEAHVAYQIRVSPDKTGPSDVVTARPGIVLPKARVKHPYRIVLETEDARPAYWTLSSGNLPDGLTLNRNGLLSGIPTAAVSCSVDLAEITPYPTRPFFERDAVVKDVRLSVEP
jgi:hypothetical protein